MISDCLLNAVTPSRAQTHLSVPQSQYYMVLTAEEARADPCNLTGHG